MLLVTLPRLDLARKSGYLQSLATYVASQVELLQIEESAEEAAAFRARQAAEAARPGEIYEELPMCLPQTLGSTLTSKCIY